MRRILLTCFLLILLTSVSLADVIISEVADPGDDYNGRFVELFNTGASSVSLDGWALRRYANANTTSADIDLTGYSIASCDTLIIANGASNFQSLYGFAPDLASGNISGNGDDTYELYNGASVEDIYGEVGTDGTGTAWEYEDSQAVRNSNVLTGNATWTSSEWTIAAADIADMTPGTHDNDNCASAEDETSPTLAGILPQTPGEIKIIFSEEVTAATAQDDTNYEVSAQPDYSNSDSILLLNFDSDTAEAPSGDYTEADDEITTFSGSSDLMVDNSTLVSAAQYVVPGFADASRGAYQGGGMMVCDSNDATNMAGVVAHPLPTYQGDFTVEAIVKFEDNTFPGRTVNLADIIGLDAAGASCATWVIRAFGPGPMRPNSIEFMYNGGTEVYANAAILPANDTWFHVAGVMDFNESNPADSHIELWIDGVRVAGPVGCNASLLNCMGGSQAKDTWLGIGCAYTSWFTGGGGDPRSFEGAFDAAALTLATLDNTSFVLPTAQSTFTASRVNNVALDHFTDGKNTSNATYWPDTHSNYSGTAADTLDGSDCLKFVDGGFGNGIYHIYDSIIPYDGNWKIKARMHAFEDQAGTNAPTNWPAATTGLGVIVNGSVSDPASILALMQNLDDGVDDSGDATEIIETSAFTASEGDSLFVRISSDPSVAQASAGWLDASYLLIDDITLVDENSTNTVVLAINDLTGEAKDVTVWAEGIEDPSGNGLEPTSFRAIPGIFAPSDVDGVNERGDTAFENVRVTVEGAITDNVIEGGKGAYIAGSGGILIYDGSSSFVADESLDVGDQIRITSTVDNYRGKGELVAGLGGFEIMPQGTTTVTPEVISMDYLGSEPFAGEAKDGDLVTINNVHFQDSDWGPWSGGTYSIDVGGQTGTLYVDWDTNLPGDGPVPSIANVTGILGQYDTSVPYDSGYQIMPRSLSDIDTVQVPVELSIFSVE